MDDWARHLAEWLDLKVKILVLNLSLTKEQRAENKQALKEWEEWRNH